MKVVNSVLCLSVFFLISGCASSYHTATPEVLKYTDGTGANGLSVGYHYGVLAEKGNKKYARHEASSKITLVALKITNQTDRALNPEKDIVFTVGQAQATPLDPKRVKMKLQQGVAGYILYMLLTPLVLNVPNNNGTSEQYPIGYGLGPLFTIINMAGAGAANGKFKKELEAYALNRDIPPGQSYFFLVGFQGIGLEPVSIKLKE